MKIKVRPNYTSQFSFKSVFYVFRSIWCVCRLWKCIQDPVDTFFLSNYYDSATELNMHICKYLIQCDIFYTTSALKVSHTQPPTTRHTFHTNTPTAINGQSDELNTHIII